MKGNIHLLFSHDNSIFLTLEELEFGFSNLGT